MTTASHFDIDTTEEDEDNLYDIFPGPDGEDHYMGEGQWVRPDGSTYSEDD